MAGIRRLVAKGYSHKEIMKQLKLPPRTYFRYLSEAFEHDWELLKQENDDPAMLAREISILKETFREAERILLQTINSPKTPVRQKIRACDALCRTATADLQLTFQGPLIMKRAIKDIDLARYFNRRFPLGEVLDFPWKDKYTYAIEN